MLTQQVIDAFTALTGHAPDRGLGRPGPDQPDRRAHRLQRRLRAAVRAAAGRLRRRGSARPDGRWRFRSVDLDETVELGQDELVPGTPGWHSYLAGVVWALQQAGHAVGGADLVLTSDVPLGAGLSSSAAIECAALAALADLNALDIEPLDRAKLARVAENAYVGAPTGLLDQAASTLCVADHALFLDCRTLETRQVPLAVTGAGLEILVIDTRTRHSHVDGEYAARRASCEEACRDPRRPGAARRHRPGRPRWRSSRSSIGRRVRHVVTENQRVLDGRDAPWTRATTPGWAS